VNIFFQGHDHLFAVEQLDGLVYQECPMPSDSTYMIGYLANADAYTGDKLIGTGHMRVTVTPDSATVEYVSSYLPRDTNATHHNGAVAYSYSVKANITSVAGEKTIPSEFIVEQNYPNPFNPSTVIRYQLKSSEFVTLKVFDILGKEVEILVNERQTSGLHEIKFNAANLSSGIYFYQLNANGSVLTKKAVLLK
jgi:hypothetical protein